MATLLNCTGVTPEKPIEPTIIELDALIMEHIYSATLKQILADDGLMTIILSNGYYRAALCEAFDCKTLEIKTKDGKVETLYGPPAGTPMIYDVIFQKSGVLTPCMTVKNHSFRDVDKFISKEEMELIAINEAISMGKYGMTDLLVKEEPKTLTPEEKMALINKHLKISTDETL